MRHPGWFLARLGVGMLAGVSCIDGPRSDGGVSCAQTATALTVSWPLPAPLSMGRYTLTLEQPDEGVWTCSFYVNVNVTTPTVGSGVCMLGPERTLRVEIDYSLSNCEGGFLAPPTSCDARYTERIVITGPPVALWLAQSGPGGSAVDVSVIPGVDQCEVEGFEAAAPVVVRHSRAAALVMRPIGG